MRHVHLVPIPLSFVGWDRERSRSRSGSVGCSAPAMKLGWGIVTTPAGATTGVGMSRMRESAVPARTRGASVWTSVAPGIFKWRATATVRSAPRSVLPAIRRPIIALAVIADAS